MHLIDLRTFVASKNQKVVGFHDIQLFNGDRLIKYWSVI